MDPSLIAGALLGACMIGFLLLIRIKDLPKPEPVSPFRHLEERKAAIYESLRDLQFEYRVDKLSDEDYQTSKLELQKELARVLQEIDRMKSEMGQPVSAFSPPASVAAPQRFTCPGCNAHFDKPLKFCGECGKPMAAAQ